jgi:hypothetical protein
MMMLSMKGGGKRAGRTREGEASWNDGKVPVESRIKSKNAGGGEF